MRLLKVLLVNLRITRESAVACRAKNRTNELFHILEYCSKNSNMLLISAAPVRGLAAFSRPCVSTHKYKVQIFVLD